MTRAARRRRLAAIPTETSKPVAGRLGLTSAADAVGKAVLDAVVRELAAGALGEGVFGALAELFPQTGEIARHRQDFSVAIG